MITLTEEQQLKRELVVLLGRMNHMRRELASLQGDSSGDFTSMADTLDAIVENTEIASNTILESMENIDTLLGELRGVEDERVGPLCDKITDNANQVFEACSFQDLTGQRITRVVKMLKFVEDRVNTMVRMWGKDELEKLIGDMQTDMVVDADKALLHGPQRTGVATTQDEIDKLFSQDDIDKLFG